MNSFGSKYLKSNKYILSLLDHSQCTSHLKQIQSHLIVSGTISDGFAAGKLISSFSDHPSLFSDAYRLLLRSPRRSTYMWNSLIKALTQNGQPIRAVSLFKDMLCSGVYPNNYTFSFLIRCCVDMNDLELGFVLHGLGFKLGWDSYDFVQNGLVHLYSVCGDVDFARELFDVCLSKDVVTWTALINGYVRIGQVSDARQLFDEMPERNVVSWSAMIGGYVQAGLFEQALEVFSEMQVCGFRPNHASIVGALTACSSLGTLDRGRWIHMYVDKNKVELDIKLGTALVDMYAKCGCIEMACCVFEDMQSKDVFAYTSLISGLSNHGLSEKAIKLFRRMQGEGVDPNGVTFICVLTACSRMGLIYQGLQIFHSMRNQYGIKPETAHYGCLVDLLGRSGMLKEAEQLVRTMSEVPDSYVLGSLLNACRVHGNVELGEEMVKRLTEQGLDKSGAHTLLSNIYASTSKWDGVTQVRSRMEDREVRKVPGCSLIEVDGVVSEFGVGLKTDTLMEDTTSSLLQIDKHSRFLCMDHDSKLAREIV